MQGEQLLIPHVAEAVWQEVIGCYVRDCGRPCCDSRCKGAGYYDDYPNLIPVQRFADYST